MSSQPATLSSLPDRSQAKAGQRPLAPAEYLGLQPGFDIMPDFELWHLTADIPGYSVRSTLSRETLEKAGYFVPPAPAVAPVREAVPAHLKAYFA